MTEHDERIREVVQNAEKLGYKALYNKGPPDLMLVKLKNNDKPISKDNLISYKFVEVKVGNDRLRHEQKIWKDLLEALGLNYEIKHFPNKKGGM
jgi:hypothetical protein